MIKDSFSHIPSANPAFILTLIKDSIPSAKSSKFSFKIMKILINVKLAMSLLITNKGTLHAALFYSALYTGWWTKNFINDAYIFYDSINKI